ncbi:MAG: hypothetical protein JWO19_151, partial [Bryobacterales bacterium]|nr:hypothetical protein [Bryobacterales bacterium]
SAQQTFPSSTEASQSLFQAVQANNEGAITKILGGPTELTSSRDPGQDKVDRELFVQKYQEMHRLCANTDGSVTLHIGAENWPFPIPLVAKNGAWHFDPDTGQKEVLYRRIGENEFAAISMCHDFVAAEKQYRAQPVNATELESTPVSLVAKAASGSASSDPVLFHGYYFKVLPGGTAGKNPGGFAFIAYPAEYRSTGVMTFVVTKNDVVYEKDLGANTTAAAAAMTAFHKDATWRTADQ